MIIAFVILYNKNEKCRQFFDKYIFRKVLYEDNLNKIDLEAYKNPTVFAYDRYIVILDQNVLNFYNTSGQKEHSIDIEISSPILEANGEYLCVAEKNGNKIILIKNRNIIWQKNIEGNISSITINKNGYVSVCISGTTYKTIVDLYDNNGKELFKKYVSNSTVIDTTISNDNKYLAIAEADFSGVVVQSMVEVISIEEVQKNAKSAIKYTYQAEADSLIIDIKYQNKNNLVCLYDKYVEKLNEGNSTKIFNFKDEAVTFADIGLNSKTIKVIKSSNGILTKQAQIKIIDTDNKEKITTYDIEAIPKEVEIREDIMAINEGTQILFINSNGWLIKSYDSSQEIQNIVFSDKIAGIISKNKIILISL